MLNWKFLVMAGINANEVILEEGSILVLNNNSHIVGDIEGNNIET